MNKVNKVNYVDKTSKKLSFHDIDVSQTSGNKPDMTNITLCRNILGIEHKARVEFVVVVVFFN